MSNSERDIFPILNRAMVNVPDQNLPLLWIPVFMVLSKKGET